MTETTTLPPLKSRLPGDSYYFKSQYGRIFYKEAGDPAKPPVVFIHGVGAGASGYIWRENFGTLSQNFHVFAYDLPGFGKSQRLPHHYTADLYITTIIDFLKNIVGQPASIVADSVSAGHAVVVAHQHPELIEKLVLLQPAGEFPEAGISAPNITGSFSYPVLRLPLVGKNLFSVVSSRFNIRFFLESQLYYNKSLATPTVIEEYYIAAHQPGAEYAPLAFFSGRLGTNFGEAFKKLTKPILLVWGKEAKISPVKQGYALLKQNSNARLEVLEEARLGCNEERPAQFNEAVKNFLNSSS